MVLALSRQDYKQREIKVEVKKTYYHTKETTARSWAEWPQTKKKTTFNCPLQKSNTSICKNHNNSHKLFLVMTGDFCPWEWWWNLCQTSSCWGPQRKVCPTYSEIWWWWNNVWGASMSGELDVGGIGMPHFTPPVSWSTGLRKKESKSWTGQPIENQDYGPRKKPKNASTEEETYKLFGENCHTWTGCSKAG